MKRDFANIASDKEAQEVLRVQRETIKSRGGRLDLVPQELKELGRLLDIDGQFAYVGGDTGTGKTFGLQILEAEAGAPVLTFQCTAATEPKDLFGGYVPNTTGKGTDWVFKPGPATICSTRGWTLILDEADTMPGVGLILLNDLFDKGKIMIDIPDVGIDANGDPIRIVKHKNFRCFLTGNSGYEVTEKIPVALKNRLDYVVSLAAMDQAAFIKFMGEKCPWLNEKFYEELFKLQVALEEMARGHEFRENVKFSVRNAEGLADLLRSPIDRKEFESMVKLKYVNFLAMDNANFAKIPKAMEALKPNISAMFGFAGASWAAAEAAERAKRQAAAAPAAPKPEPAKPSPSGLVVDEPKKADDGLMSTGDYLAAWGL